MKQTALHDVHLALGADMAPFSGFSMPIRYRGIVAEHQACRRRAAIFDTCHMGEIKVSGPGAAADLDAIVSCHVADLAPGRCRYGLLCNERGGVLDDLICYRLDATTFLLVVNAGPCRSDLAWIERRVSARTQVEDLSETTAKIDLQGPAAPRILQALTPDPLGELPYFGFVPADFRGERILVSRTGYTGEIGFELYASEATAVQLWNDCLAAGAEPAGLGARDTLRLEAGLPLYGHELSQDRNAAESGFTRVLPVDKQFVGAEAVRRADAAPARLVCVAFAGRRAARAGDDIASESGERIGLVTSGSFAPSLGKAIAMGYVDRRFAETGARVVAQTARAELRGSILPRPLYRKGTVRRPMRQFLSQGDKKGRQKT